ncbi:MAG: hypothetical protein WAW59_05540 [Patescibacteria group bacterium]
MTFAWIGCDGTVVSRTDVGRLEVFYTEKNFPGCLGPKWVDPAIVVEPEVVVSTGTLVNTGTTLTGTTLTGTTATGETTQEEILTGTVLTGYDPEIDGPLFDLAQTDIVAYRIELMKARQIRYTNALRSVRMREQATKNSDTEAYLMRNDAVVVTQSGAGWTGVQGATVSVTDTGANLVEADTTGKADGYIATKYLRNPNTSDLVRIEQADQQFWSDIARVNVEHSVNVRAHPWYGAKILFVLTNATPLYVVSTVDNWSEVISDDRTLHGYIRSDYLTIEKKQRVEVEPLLK